MLGPHRTLRSRILLVSPMLSAPCGARIPSHTHPSPHSPELPSLPVPPQAFRGIFVRQSRLQAERFSSPAIMNAPLPQKVQFPPLQTKDRPALRPLASWPRESAAKCLPSNVSSASV